MKKCEYCGEIIRGKKKTARFCSDFCRLRAFRAKNGSKYQGKTRRRKMDSKLFFGGQEANSFTCCENAKFYSPAFLWGKLLICDNCGAVWQRLDKDPRMKNQDNQDPEE